MCTQFFERILKVIAECASNNQAAFSKKIGEAQSTVHGYLNPEGQDKVKSKTIIRILEEFKVNANWLLLGEGPMFRDQIQTLADPIAQRVEAVGRAMRESGAAEADILKAIRAMIDGEIAKAEPATEPDPGSAAGSASA